MDSLRFFSFVLIFLHHAGLPDTPFLSRIQAAGWVGVDIFFCLSAYLLTRLLRDEYRLNGRVDVAKFFTRRILRIWPLYFLFVVLAVVMHLFLGPSVPEIDGRRVVGLATFTDNIFAAVAGYNPISFTAHLWTISYEEQFYLCIPLAIPFLLKCSKARRYLLLLSIFIIGSLLRFVLITNDVSGVAIYVLPLTHFESILMGMVLAWSGHARRGSWAACVVCLIVILMLPAPAVGGLHLAILYPMVGLLTGAILSIALRPGRGFTKRILNFPPLVYFGKISFGLYVFHILALHAGSFIFQNRFPYLEALTGFLITLILAAVSYHVVERRFLRLKKKFTVIPNKPV